MQHLLRTKFWSRKYCDCWLAYSSADGASTIGCPSVSRCASHIAPSESPYQSTRTECIRYCRYCCSSHQRDVTVSRDSHWRLTLQMDTGNVLVGVSLVCIKHFRFAELDDFNSLQLVHHKPDNVVSLCVLVISLIIRRPT